ncbi:MAG: hypothetical protein ACREDS_08465 [Limisphaerales bacterium]
MQYVKTPLMSAGEIKPNQLKCCGIEPFAGTMQLGMTIANARNARTTLSNILTATKRLGAVWFIAS